MGFIIFSASSSSRTQLENQNATLAAKILLNHHRALYKNVEGCYKGGHEVSFLVADNHIELIELLCHLFEQESFLLVDDNRNATLRYEDLRRRNIGLWQNVCKSVALAQDSYTVCDGHYWICSPDLYPTPALSSRI
jgi:hypothetical protein